MPPTRAACYVYFAHAGLSPAELSAARLDGHLVELGEGYIPADAVETPALRAASLTPILGDLLAATHSSAAWVHGALDAPPRRHTVQRAVDHRIGHVVGRGVVYRDGRLPEHDIVRIGGMAVSSPSRTLADLARQRVVGADLDDERQLDRAIARLGSRTRVVRGAIVRLAVQDGPPGKPAALDLLRRLERSATRW
ncbi:MAG: hypothetical protein QM611_07675 [Microbacterium sp.]|uniref:hypothetical protein n=1 Tax=Microbacterium sp. TaxID=51671 RepID=UPI0039E61DBA